MPSEFGLIARYFTHPARNAVLGVGDDAALMRASPGMELAVSTDMLVAGTHFFADADPRRLGHKALAVNLSDMAAMGATPRWALLAISLPQIDTSWIARFMRGFMTLARRHDVDLVGGDTTRGPLNVSVTILGEVPRAKALRRDGARAGDDIWVSGTLGDAALAVAQRLGRVQLSDAEKKACLRALDLPEPQIALGVGLRGVARSAIDVSDGLVADLGHICERSGLGADVWMPAVPRTSRLESRIGTAVGLAALFAGGDDYQLCFTAAQVRRARVVAIGRRVGATLSRIGVMRAGRGVRVLDAGGRRLPLARGGYDHFG
jgi:thiamine-monophosphate kinase